MAGKLWGFADSLINEFSFARDIGKIGAGRGVRQRGQKEWGTHLGA